MSTKTALIFTLNDKITTFSAGSNLLLSPKHSIQGRDLLEFIEMKKNYIALFKETNKLAVYSVSDEGAYKCWRFEEMDAFLALYHKQISENPACFTVEPQGTISFVFNDTKILGIDSCLYLEQPVMAFVHKDDHLGFFGILNLPTGKITVRWKYCNGAESVNSDACEYRWVELVTIFRENTRLILPKELFPSPLIVSIANRIPFLQYVERSITRLIPRYPLPTRFKLMTIVKYWQCNVMNFKLFLESAVFKAKTLGGAKQDNRESHALIRRENSTRSYIVSLAHNTLNMLFDWIALKPIFN